MRAECQCLWMDAIDGQTFRRAGNMGGCRGISRWRSLQKFIKGFLNLLQPKLAGGLGVRSDPKWLNRLSERAEVISMCPVVPCFNWQRNIQKLEEMSSCEKWVILPQDCWMKLK